MFSLSNSILNTCDPLEPFRTPFFFKVLTLLGPPCICMSILLAVTLQGRSKAEAFANMREDTEHM